MKNTKTNTQEDIKKFHLPRYQEIPDVGLFLEQTVRLINHYLKPLGNIELTPAMVSNYVKNKIISPPKKKQYDRNQIGYLIFISVAKTIMPLDDIKDLFHLQKENFDPQIAYNYFCDEFENTLQHVFCNNELKTISSTNAQVRILLRNIIIAISYKIYLDKYLQDMRENSKNKQLPLK